MAKRPKDGDPERDDSAEAAPDAEAPPAVPPPRELSRDELESLRARLQKKFH
jgi:hypothetical protein